MKKLLSILCAAALTLSLAACGSSATENYAGQTLTGQVTAIDGSAVTLQLGELAEDTNTPPDGGSDAQAPPDGGSDTNTPPEKPDDSSDSGTANGQPPAKPDDASGDANGQPPDMPSGDAPSGGPGGSSFTAGDETVTLDFSAAEITENGETAALSDLAEGDVITVTVGSGTAVTTAEIVNVGGGQGGPGAAGDRQRCSRRGRRPRRPVPCLRRGRCP